MIILYNYEGKDSRDFLVEILGELPDHAEFENGKQVVGDHTIYCWYHGGRETFWAEGQTTGVSAFPSVVANVPEYDVPASVFTDPETGEDVEQPKRTVAAHQRMLRMPGDMADVEDFIDEINIDLANSRVAGKEVPLMTLENMNQI